MFNAQKNVNIPYPGSGYIINGYGSGYYFIRRKLVFIVQDLKHLLGGGGTKG
jgi:hypothetical protein